MTVKELLDALMALPADALDMEIEIDLDVEYPSGDLGAEDWIVSPAIAAVTWHEGEMRNGQSWTRRYVELEVKG